jgi:predicted alpha-1,2-mannosidase
MKNYFGFVLLLLISMASCSDFSKDSQSSSFIEYVNPFIGTQRMGHTFPGATVPFGMVQLSPDTDTIAYELNGGYNKRVYDYCAGYQYDDPTIVGFSHTHFSGTGHSDLGDFLIMPTTGKLQLNPGTAENPETGYRSRFSHQNEFAEPNYYQVLLEDYQVNAELTTSTRVGFHRYSFPENAEANIILDLMHGIYNYDGKNVWTFVRVENDTLVTGYRQTRGWARTRKVFFAMSFDQPIVNYGHKKYDQVVYRDFYRRFDETANFPEMSGCEIRAYFQFGKPLGNEIKIKFALSPVSTAGALKNLKAEIPHWDFDKTKLAGQKLWNDELAKINVETLTDNDRTVFYTALYHSFLTPIVYQDVDGNYRGLDQNIHRVSGFTNYSIFSLWDTYRALHPLFNLVQPKRNSDIIESMMAHYDQSVHSMLPVWSHYAGENWCMIGYHSVSVVADAIVKGTYSGNIDAALTACIATASYPLYDGIGDYLQMGFVPEDKNSNSVSKTLEYAYDDWAIAQIANIAGNQTAYETFMQRSESYRRVFDIESGFMRPKMSDGTFRKNFDPLDTHGQGFIEGNAWNYSFYVPHAPESLIELKGGRQAFAALLDSLFVKELSDEHIEANEDITRDGIIGLYVHGNEPGHQIPYFYNWADQPWKAQARVRMIMETMYANAPDGLCGNDDCGQMSAWYIFSALGFYPVCPGSDEYAIGSPLVKSATIDLGNGRTLLIIAQNQSSENVYVEEVWLNDRKLENFILKHSEIVKGGVLKFKMSNIPKVNPA